MGATASLPLVAEGELVGFVVMCQRDTRRLASSRPALEACGRHSARRWHQQTSRERARTRGETLRRTQQLGVAGQVAASVAHEVRNPLAAIRSLVQFARDVALPEAERTTVLGDVIEEVDRIDQTVTSMLQLSQPASTERWTVDVRALLRSATHFVRAYAGRRQVLIEMESTRDGLWVLADERELRQTLTNLLLNACQACEGGGRVTASASLVASFLEAGAWADVTITDSGNGIAPEHLNRLFEPFFTTKPQGTGLGLPFCRDVVERHGGTITIRSTVGVGTTACVRLPLLERDDVDPRR
jgi:signal transduction histidine kinase